MYSGTSHCCGNKDTFLIWTLAFVPIVVILYKTTPELRTPLQSGQLNAHGSMYVFYCISNYCVSLPLKNVCLVMSIFCSPCAIVKRACGLMNNHKILV